jgi:hypothetical protein
MVKRTLMLWAALMLAGSGLYIQEASGAGDGKPAQTQPRSPYRVGDTLKPGKADKATGSYEETYWETLRPNGWEPNNLLEALNLNELGDNDPKVKEVMRKIREMWDNAPVNTDLNNRRIRIPGFVVPLDGQRDQVQEFLLVPYFGACIHVPPPPANQIVHVVVAKTAKKVQLMRAVWVSGTIHTARSETRMGSSGYEMSADLIEPYELEEWSPI